MNRKERKELAEEVEERLDEELEFELEYKISDYAIHDSNDDKISVIDINIDIEDQDYPEDFSEQVEDVIEGIIDEWGGTYSWDGWCISISIPDDDD